MSFKVGDRVRAKGIMSGKNVEGLIGEIQENNRVGIGGVWPTIKFENFNWDVYHTQLELIEPESPFTTLTEAHIRGVIEVLKRNSFYSNPLTMDWGYNPTPKKKPIMSRLNNMMKRLLDGDTQILVKAGYINGGLELTEKGQEALDSVLFAANKAELVTLAQADLDEEKKAA